MHINLKKMSLRRLHNLIEERGQEVYGEIIRVLAHDPREGAQRLVRLCQSRQEEWQRERQRMVRLFGYERQVWAMGYQVAAGLAEVGRGALAGPVVAAAVVLPPEAALPGLDETKRLNVRRRRDLYEAIRSVARGVGIGLVQPEGVDEANVALATYRAMAKAVADLKIPPEYLLVDGIHLPGVAQPQTVVVASEGLSGSVAAASVVAKITRDDFMLEMDKLYPNYGFANHKGYGTAEHRDALERFGPCPLHRRQWRTGEEVNPAAAHLARLNGTT